MKLNRIAEDFDEYEDLPNQDTAGFQIHCHICYEPYTVNEFGEDTTGQVMSNCEWCDEFICPNCKPNHVDAGQTGDRCVQKDDPRR